LKNNKIAQKRHWTRLSRIVRLRGSQLQKSTMHQDVPTDIFLDQISNTTVRSALVGTGSLPDSITPSALLFCLTDALSKAQDIFNKENADIPNVATVSGRELGPVAVTADGTLRTQIFYTIGGNITFESGSAEPIIL